MNTKNQIARNLYGCNFASCSSGEKATVTRNYNAQSRTATGAIVSVSIGRVGVNGVKTCQMSEGSTVKDLIAQADYVLDSKKESVIALSTGSAIGLNEVVVNGEEYSITPGIDSAF